MNKKFALIGGDKRNILLADELKKNGHEVIMYGFDKADIENKMSLIDTINYCDFIICAIPFTRDLMTLNMPLTTEKISIEDFLKIVPKNKVIFAGATSNKITTDNTLVDVYKTDQIKEKSTIATAEGAIKIAVENTDISLYGSNALIIGYGKIGSTLAKYFHSLGVNVTIISRSPKTINQAINDGFNAYSSFELDRNLSDKHLIFNTAEKIQINKTNIDTIDKGCVYIELASSPFGIDYEECITSDIKIIFGSSLPGIFSPRTIAIALYDEIFKYIKEMKE